MPWVHGFCCSLSSLPWRLSACLPACFLRCGPGLALNFRCWCASCVCICLILRILSLILGLSYALAGFVPVIIVTFCSCSLFFLLSSSVVDLSPALEGFAGPGCRVVVVLATVDASLRMGADVRSPAWGTFRRLSFSVSVSMLFGAAVCTARRINALSGGMAPLLASGTSPEA